VGQLVAEAIRLYGRRFVLALPLGLAPAVLDLVASQLARGVAVLFAALAGSVFLTGSYLGASLLASEARPELRPLLTGFAGGALVFLPFPFLAGFFILPGLAWLALAGLIVPVAVIERRGLRDSFGRAILLGRADYVHALGSLATLAIAVFLTRAALFFLLRDFGETTARTAAFLADLVLSPLMFLGAALLYFDQAARAVDSRGQRKSVRRRSRADLHHADEPHRPGRADAEVESRPPARGEP
jgi:hypothetical protein